MLGSLGSEKILTNWNFESQKYNMIDYNRGTQKRGIKRVDGGSRAGVLSLRAQGKNPSSCYIK